MPNKKEAQTLWHLMSDLCDYMHDYILRNAQEPDFDFESSFYLIGVLRGYQTAVLTLWLWGYE